MEGERRRAHPGKNGGERDLSLSPVFDQRGDKRQDETDSCGNA